MPFQTVFKRYEIKYLISRAQAEEIKALMSPYMMPDIYGRSTVRNVYYDTASHRLIRRSLERPVYKEKLRLRAYCDITGSDSIFIEVKKKFQSVVYKRRLLLENDRAVDWMAGGVPVTDSQIAREIEYFRSYYGPLLPSTYISYEREAFVGKEDDTLRMTFDENILARTDRLSLCDPPDGVPLLPEDCVLLEVKSIGSIPLWLTPYLTRERIYHQSFSKYGSAYTDLIFQGEKSNNEPILKGLV